MFGDGKNYTRVLGNILKNTGADRFLITYLIFVFADAALIMIFEPTIDSYGDALWYCYAVISTAGFGDVVVTTLIPRILSVLLTVYSIIIIAIVTGVVVNFYTQMINIRNKDTVVTFLNRIEHLPELNEEELKELAENVRKFRDTGRLNKTFYGGNE